MVPTRLRTLLVSTAILVGSVSLPAWADDASYTTKNLNEQLVMSNLWMQASAEFRGMSYQAFNLAKMRFDSYASTHKGDKKIAIVVDADETIISNSAYESWLVGRNESYSSKTWGEWMASAEATALPGSVDFLNYAVKHGAEVFYITNRKMSGLEGTRKNLKELGFPDVDDAHLMLKTTTSDKEPRRLKVAEHYDIALFMGDNLNDFSKDFKTKSLKESYAAVEKDKALFGTKFILLPNPAYGDWEGKVYNNNWGASAAEKDAMRKAHLHAWQPKK